MCCVDQLKQVHFVLHNVTTGLRRMLGQLQFCFLIKVMMGLSGTVCGKAKGRSFGIHLVDQC